MRKNIRNIIIFGLVSVFLFFSPMFITWIPIVNNIFLGLGFISFIFFEIYLIKIISKLEFTNKYFRILKYIVIGCLVIVFLLFQYILFFLALFSGKNGPSFSYNQDNYYYVNEGFINPVYVIYKKIVH